MAAPKRLFDTLRRTAWQAVPTILAIVVIDFFLLRLAPGDAADALAAESGSATEETMAALRAHFGLDQPVLHQFLAYLDNLVHFSLGFSPLYNMPVSRLIGDRLPGSLLLMATALSLALLVGVTAGVVMSSFAGRLPDRVLSIVALLFYSIPGFWIGLMLIVVFSVWLGWLPSGGAETIGAGLTGWTWLADRVRHLVLPAASLALFFIAIYARLVRASMLQVRDQDYVRTAVAKGLSRRIVTLRHMLWNALLPVTTVAGMHVGAILGGAVVVETVFSWPGLGRLAFEAVLKRDFSVLLGILLLSSMMVIIVNMLVDVLQAWLDPRIELR
jgi:peptide/nickel transport system permease protein